MKNSQVTLEAAISQTVRRLRAERTWSQEDLARHSREDAGLDWTRETVAAIERGTRRVTISEWIVLGYLFTKELHHFLPEEVEALHITPTFSISSKTLRAVLTGKLGSQLPRDFDAPKQLGAAHALKNVAVEDAAQNIAEQQAAKKLGVLPRLLSAAAFGAWGRSLSDERDQRLRELGSMPPRRKQAVRGHITRELLRELSTRLQKSGDLAKVPGTTKK